MCKFHAKVKGELIYRGSRDGFSAKEFHSKCDGKVNTLTIIKSTNGNIFGGFTTEAWSSSESWVKDTRAFVFSLVNNKNKPFRRGYQGKDKSSLWCSSSYGPCFGNDIVIASNSNANLNSFANFGHSYKHRSYKQGSDSAMTILAGSFGFQTLEIEVFSLTKFRSHLVSEDG